MRAGRSARRGVRAASHHVRGGVYMAARRCLATGTGPVGPTAARPPPAAVTAQTPCWGAACARLCLRFTAGSAAGPTQLCLAANPAEKPL